MSGNFPIVRLELQRMQHSIMACLLPALEAEKETIEALVAEEVKRFDFAAECRSVIRAQLHNQIGEAIKSAVERVFYSPEVRAVLDEAAKQHVRSILELMVK